MCAKAVLSSKGQLVIPKILRDKLGIQSGSQLTIRLKAGNILEVSCVQNPISNFFGMGNGIVKANKNITEIDDLIIKAVEQNDKY